MTMQERFFEMSAQAREQAAVYAQRAARIAVQGLDRTASQVEALRGPVSELTAAGLELNQKSAQFVEQLLQRQSRLAATLLSGGARRLRALAEAADATVAAPAKRPARARKTRAASPRRAVRARKVATAH